MSARQSGLAGGAATHQRTPARRWPLVTAAQMAAQQIVAAEPAIAVVTAALLLAVPLLSFWPAVIAGAVPSLARLVLAGRPWRRTAFDWPLVFLACGAALGAYGSLNPGGVYVRIAGLLAGLYLFVAAREHAWQEEQLRALVVGLLAAAVAACLAMLVLVAPFLRLDHIPPLAWLVAAVDRWNLGVWFSDQDWLLQRYRFRASGVGSTADLGLALAFAAFIGLRGRLARLLVVASVPIFLATLVVAENRGAMLAGALTLGIMATVWRPRLLPLIPLGALLAVAAFATGLVERGLSLRTLSQRFWFWENAVYLARELPLTGAGISMESVQATYRTYFEPVYPPFSHAHSIYLQGLLEYGVFGMLGLVGLALATLWVGWRADRVTTGWRLAGRLVGLGLAMVMFTAGLSEVALLTTVGGALTLAALGLLAATSEPASRAIPPRATPSRAIREAAAPARTTPVDGFTAGGATRCGAALEAAPDAVSATRDATAARPGGHRHGALARRPVPIYWAVVALAGIVVVTGVAVAGPSWMAARVLLNLGTVQLNQATISEVVGKSERTERLDRALSLLQSAARLDDTDPTLQRNLSLVLAAQNDDRLARAAVDRAKALTDPENKPDLFQLGRAYEANTMWGDTIQAWQAAGAAPQLVVLGNKLIRAKNYERAIAAFSAAATLRPADSAGYDGIARASRERGRSTAEVLAALAPLMQPGTPTEYGARLQTARIEREAGLLREALDELDRAQQIAAGPDLSLESGMTLIQADLPDQAEPLLLRAVDDIPGDSDGWTWLAYAQGQLGRHDEAVQTAQIGLARLNPGDPFGAPGHWEPARLDPIGRSARALLLRVLGENLLAVDRVDDAIAALSEAGSSRKDARIEAALAQARDVATGRPRNLLTNPDFAGGDAWAVRADFGTTRPLPDTLTSEHAEFSDGIATLTIQPSADRVLAQEVRGLQPGVTYRLTARVRPRGLYQGAPRLAVIVPIVYAMQTGLQRPQAIVERSAPADGWTILQLEFTAPISEALVSLGVTDGATVGASLDCDDVSLIALNSPH
ncbi:MAG: O-antigen ligase family protein [Chloroflexi bacterium]|nr:O-antigen ligase family protein [Chloroflexota bacterium]